MQSYFYVIWFSSFYIEQCLSSPEADWDDAFIRDREPVFRKDYTLDEHKRGWFKLHRVPENWFDAHERCRLEGAELASPLNNEILQAMTSKMLGLKEVFTGIHSMFSYGDYYSLKGVPLTEMPVSWSYLLSSDVVKQCVVLLPDGTINNVNCNSATLPYICYKDNNYTPLTECGTVDTGYTLNKDLDTCYKLHARVTDWSYAFKICSAEGGHLLVLNSEAELNAVLRLFENSTDEVTGQDINYVLLGVLNWQNSVKRVTIHDEALEKYTFLKWDPNSPSSSNWVFLGRSGTLQTNGNNGHFICEKKPDSLITMYQLFEVTRHSIDI